MPVAREHGVLALAALAAACGGSLGQLQDPALTARTDGTALFLDVTFSNAGCPSVPGARATFDGLPLTALSLGGAAQGGLLAGCNAIRFSGSAPASPTDATATFEVSDGSRSLAMSAPGYFAARSLTLPGPDAGRLRAGETVIAQASPPTDRFDTAPGVAAEFTADGSTQPSFVVKSGVAVDGGAFQFAVPAAGSPIPDGGVPGVLTVQPGTTLSQVSSCTGAASCEARLQASYSAPATLVP